jgi:TatD DNase family protein
VAEAPLVDTHCHVDFPHFSDDRDEVLARFRQAGGRWLVAVAVDLDNLPRLFALAESESDVYCSVGVHPNHEVEAEPTEDELCGLAAHGKCVAIGETGLDFFRHHVPPEVQELRFRTHIRAAKSLSKPVIVHMREADEATLRVMGEEDISACGGIMHCFSSSWEVARKALDMGMSMSFTGNVTFKNNHELRDVAKQVPEDMLLIETDSPYLAPVPNRGKRNEPAYVRQVAECIAEVRGVSLAHLAEITTANAARRFGIS